MPRKPIMIMGCTSDAGKSFLVTALCRYFSNKGLSVAPFKAQNMSNNAAVTPEGLEIGRAQYLQAIAARVEPQVRMNPVLLKPSADTFSQVVVMGKANAAISHMPWLERKPVLWPMVQKALHTLLTDFEQVVIEGAGSPAEVNLRESDIVNMQVALECGAEVYLVADIDRGGAFAHLLGTWECLTLEEKALIKGFVLNKFRGDPTLLGNASEWLQVRTGIPTVALVPYITHALPEEDAFPYQASPEPRQINIALLLYPYASNLDEFDPLIHTAGVNVVPVRGFAPLDQYHAIILPGSKNTAHSLRYLREMGLAAEVSRAGSSGSMVLGICGGLQLLGKEINDPHSLESGDEVGLGLLDLSTTFREDKTTRQREIVWEGQTLHGYEIHHGETTAGAKVQPYLPEGLGWRQSNVTGVYLHGLFENASYLKNFLRPLGWRGEVAGNWDELVDSDIERAANLIVESGWVDSL